jgi:hypothetical protein
MEIGDREITRRPSMSGLHVIINKNFTRGFKRLVYKYSLTWIDRKHSAHVVPLSAKSAKELIASGMCTEG